MWQRFTIYDSRVIAHYLGVLIVLVGAAQLVPFTTAIVFREWDAAARYLLSVGISLTVGMGLRMLRIEPGQLNRQQALAVTGLGWFVLGLISAIPFTSCGHYPNYFDALFDCVSAYSATGVSILSNIDHLSNADNMWRFVMHFLGGLGLVVVAMSLGAMGHNSTSSLYLAEGRSEHVVPNVLETARFIMRFSLSIIVVFTVVLSTMMIIDGMHIDRAVLHSFWISISGFMTAGFAPTSQSITYYHSIAIEWVIMILMLIGGINFSLHWEIWKGRSLRFFKDLEIRSALVWWLILAVVLMVSLAKSPLLGSFTDMGRLGLFNFISAATTTGFTTISVNQIHTALPSGAMVILALAMAIGTCSGSTAGGIKLLRVGIIAKSAYETMKRALSPDSAVLASTYNHVGKHTLTDNVVKEAMTVFILFTITYAIGALVGIAYGYDAISSIFESVTVASNSGISAGISSTSMPLPLEVVYIIEMWAGRLEFVTFFALAIKLFVSLKPHLQKQRHLPTAVS